MLRTRNTVWLSLPALLAGCAVERGALDFPEPLFDVHLGSLGLIGFPSSTVLRIGGTYFTLSLPFYVPLVLLIAAAFAVFSLWRRKRA